MSSIYDVYKPIYGFPKDGQEITFVSDDERLPFSHNSMNEDLLVSGNKYTVRKTEKRKYIWRVWLEEFKEQTPEPYFNLKHFTWKKPSLNFDELVGYSYHSIVKLHKYYGVGIVVNGDLIKRGDPVLDIVCDVEKKGTPVTSIKYKDEC